MKVALITGSFDPVTRGHFDLIRRTAALFERVEVVLFRNSEKSPMFSEAERLTWLSAVCRDAGENVRVAISEGTVADYARERGIRVIVKGVRNAADLAYEQDMAALNRMAGGCETLFLPTDPALSFVSSSAVREFLRRDLDAKGLLPEVIADDVISAFAARR